MKCHLEKLYRIILPLCFLANILFSQTQTDALFDAVKNTDSEKITQLLAAGANVNAVDEDGYAPIHLAVLLGKNVSLDALLKAKNIDKEIALPEGSSINGWMLDGATPLILAAFLGNTDILITLLKNGANVKAVDSVDSAMAIHVASANGHTKTVEAILDSDASKKSGINMLEAKDENDNTALHWAAMKGNVETVKLLLKRKANVKAIDSDGWLPLHYASAFAGSDTVKLLIDAKSDINLEDAEGQTPLDYAIHAENEEAIILLTQSGARNGSGYTDSDEDYNEGDYYEDEETFVNLDSSQLELMLLVKNGDIIGINKLLNTDKVSPNFLDEDGYSPLHFAIYNNKINSLESLLKAKDINKEIAMGDAASLNGWYLAGATPLIFAAFLGNTDMVNILLKNGVDVRAKDFVDKAMAIHVAAANGHTDTVLALIRFDKTLINVGDETDTPPLHWAAMKGQVQTLNLLIKEGANINKLDSDGWSALHYAATSGMQTTEALVNAGANKNIKSSDGLTPAEVADEYGNYEVAEYLGGRVSKPGSTPSKDKERVKWWKVF